MGREAASRVRETCLKIQISPENALGVIIIKKKYGGKINCCCYDFSSSPKFASSMAVSLPSINKCKDENRCQKLSHFWNFQPLIIHIKPPPPAVQYSEYVHPPFCQICAVCVWFIFCVFDVLHNVGKERSDSLSKNLTVCVTICPRIHRLLVNQMSLWISEVFGTVLAALHMHWGESTTGFLVTWEMSAFSLIISGTSHHCLLAGSQPRTCRGYLAKLDLLQAAHGEWFAIGGRGKTLGGGWDLQALACFWLCVCLFLTVTLFLAVPFTRGCDAFASVFCSPLARFSALGPSSCSGFLWDCSALLPWATRRGKGWSPECNSGSEIRDRSC